MDLLLFFWILFNGVIPPAIVCAIFLYFQYKMGKKQLEQSIDGLRAYAKKELLEDVGEALSCRLNAMFGGISKQGSIEAQGATLEYAKQNPGIAQMLMNVAGRGGARWLARKLGVPKDVADSLAGLGTTMKIPLPTRGQDQPQYQPIQDPMMDGPTPFSNINKALSGQKF